MAPRTDPRKTVAEPARPFIDAFMHLFDTAKTLIERIAGARINDDTTKLPKRYARDLTRAEYRIERARDWFAAIASLIGGNTYYLLPLSLRLKEGKRYFLLSKALRGEAKIPKGPPSTARQRDLAQLRYMRQQLAKQPTDKLVRRHARALNIREDSDAWPTSLLGITDPPAVWANRTYRNGKRTAPPKTHNWGKPKPPPKPQAQHQDQDQADPAPVPFHQLE